MREEAGSVQRRSFLGLVLGGGAAAAGGCVIGGVDTTAESFNAAWELRAEQLEGASTTVYTAAAPGMWAGKEGTHVPTVTQNADGTVTVSSSHGMAEGHWITTLFVRDQTGRVIRLEDFTGRGPGTGPATMTFAPSPGTRSITAYAYCNLHDLWASAEQRI